MLLATLLDLSYPKHQYQLHSLWVVLLRLIVCRVVGAVVIGVGVVCLVVFMSLWLGLRVLGVLQCAKWLMSIPSSFAGALSVVVVMG
jgi:uncharacterized membrane protein